MQMNLNDNELPSPFESLREVVVTVEPRLRPIPEMRMHVSRFVDGADMDEVFPNLFLGDCDAAMNESYLRKTGITHILNAAGNTCGPAPVKTGQSFYKCQKDRSHMKNLEEKKKQSCHDPSQEDPSLVYLGLNLIDLPFINISVHFDKGARFVDEALASGGKVLVHCRQGRSRSASIVVAFLMMHRGMAAASALTMLRKTGGEAMSCMHAVLTAVCQSEREIRPNNGFLQHLADLEMNLFRMKLEKMREEPSSSSSSPPESQETESESEDEEQFINKRKGEEGFKEGDEKSEGETEEEEGESEVEDEEESEVEDEESEVEDEEESEVEDEEESEVEDEEESEVEDEEESEVEDEEESEVEDEESEVEDEEESEVEDEESEEEEEESEEESELDDEEESEDSSNNNHE
ncbi:Inactive dual specificity phosphatase 27 [Chionoecetes opilio]|uniref:protein-serine/threonine phosphatase n=1 Tax=Chionoecetes opilio TaxID=41210 RepID=A0A8J4XQ56_CHIOP|nr:Inactive dual specificity phosphatase 27 [Chionoecetes opilio]